VELSRRRLLVLGAASLVAGCTSDQPSSRADATGAPSPTRSGTPTSSRSEAALPRVRRWDPDKNELVPAAKISAVRAIEKSGDRAASVVRVIDAQYGGLLPGSASVLVVCRSWARDAGGEIHRGGATYDVRLVHSGSGWQVTAVHPSHPGPPAPHLSRAAGRVLADRRIELPPAAHADVRSGQVHDSVLLAMLTLARTYRIGVSVVRSGHPTYVFGTNRLSDHPRGRAFDTWRIDGHPVVDARTPRRLVMGYMEAAAAAGSYNVGGPYLLGSAPQFFSDDTHHDHVHAGFST
jgi:hypothetical protein